MIWDPTPCASTHSRTRSTHSSRAATRRGNRVNVDLGSCVAAQCARASASCCQGFARPPVLVGFEDVKLSPALRAACCDAMGPSIMSTACAHFSCSIASLLHQPTPSSTRRQQGNAVVTLAIAGPIFSFLPHSPNVRLVWSRSWLPDTLCTKVIHEP